MEIKQIGIVGCGAMGAGITQLVLQTGYTVVVNEMDKNLLNKGLNRIKTGLEKLSEKGKIKTEDKDAMLQRLSGTVNLSDMASCDLIIEAVFEDINVKNEIFTALDKACKKETIFTSNTSSLPISKMAVQTSRKEKFIGLHFFNPVAVMPLVEVIKTIATDPQIIEIAVNFVKSLGKYPIIAKDNAGFIVNLFLTPFMLDAMRAVGEGVASINDIDMGMKLGCNHPMGPLMLADFIGLDVINNASNILFNEYKEKRYAPPPLLSKMVTMGYLGLKSGRGFYDWSDPKNPIPIDLGM
jgi:3-hydroxybutyryl-CoA dehydrogenase